MRLIKTFRFEAAHATPWRDDPSHLHGHSFQVEVAVAGPCDETLGWVMDYGEIGRAFEPLFGRLDHRFLNDVDGLGVLKKAQEVLPDAEVVLITGHGTIPSAVTAIQPPKRCLQTSPALLAD